MKRKLLLLIAVLTMMVPGVALTTASPAHAAQITGCHKIACFEVYTGNKNYSNRTQWADAITAISMGGNGTIEAWGDGFYYKAYGQRFTWNIKRWVRSGTNICAAVTVPGAERRIACMSIRV